MISIIDDDESMREATKGLVRSLGYEATVFQSAEDFLQSERADDTSCIITDIQMPGLSGLDLQDRLLAKGCTTPIIFITAFPHERARTKAIMAGACGFLSKPFDDEKLISCLDKALAR
jgi:FixJ family two-component response regulator